MGNEYNKQLIDAYNNDKYNSVKFNFSLESFLSEIESSPISHNTYLQKLNRYCRYIDQTKFKQNLNYLISKILSISPILNQDNDIYLSLSCIFGSFLGDSMGTFCEDKPLNKLNHERIYNKESNTFLNPGAVTDDSEMAMSFSYAILDSPQLSILDQNIIFYYYGIWAYSEPISMGNTTSNSLFQFKIEKDNILRQNLFSENIKNKIYEINKEMKSNGFLMRLSTFIVWFYYINKESLKILFSNNNYIQIYNNIKNIIVKDIEITHPNIENVISGSIYVFIGLCSMFLYKASDIIEKVKSLLESEPFNNKDNHTETRVKNIIDNCLEEYQKENFDKYIYFESINKNSGWYIHAFKLVFYYLYIFDNLKNNKNIENVYSYIIKEICDFGGDTDTNCCIVGGIIGPMIGFFNFEKKYFDIFIHYYSDFRIQYTNAFMYYFVKYLENAKQLNDKIDNKNEKRIKFNYITFLYYMIIGDISNII
jgi:ADP-ribosylglycohydrolase